MLSRIRAYGLTVAALLALVAVLPSGLAARPRPGVTPPGGFRLFARSLGAMTVNRVACGLGSNGRICADSTNSSTVPGGFWPKGTPDQYVFNSGMQFGGIISNPSGAWNNDTTGAFFFDSRGDLADGQEVQPIYNSQSAADLAAWPAAANVPQFDRGSNTYFSLLQGQKAASQGDVWFLTWDGNPALIAGRKHPLGVLVETRIMGWNYPAGNQDILYLVYTFYNISEASDCPGAYAGVRPSMQAILGAQASLFQAQNNTAFNVTLPHCGYTIKNFFANFSADPDVTPDAGKNYGSVNLPYQLGYVYSSYFSAHSGNQGYPGDILADPFMTGYGFVGVKYLASPINPSTGREAGLSLFSIYENGGTFADPANALQLYRYMSGQINGALGDGHCTNNPLVDHICYVENSSPQDMRFFQSSGPFDLPPGGSGSVVVAYLFAPAVKAGVCQVPNSGGCTNVPPGDPTVLSSVANLVSGNVNLVDSMTGYRGYLSSGETTPDETHFVVTKGSLLDKANIAQLVFNGKFLLPVAPATPDFFLVPGDNQVAVFWRPSPSDSGQAAAGDLYYKIASNPVTVDSLGNNTTFPNPLYDPNYRQYDVEGYRVYRGRNQGDLKLLAQFDKQGTVIHDHTGQVNPIETCAPELGIFTSCPLTGTSSQQYDTLVPGVASTHSVAVPLVSPLVQVVLRTGRVKLADGTALIVAADTAVTGGASGKFPPLSDTGIPFVYVDKTALNNIRYFYAVTAFDLNSLQSGPSSLESAQSPKAATPLHPASNWDNTGNLAVHIIGRGVPMDSVISVAPTLNSTTGIFSGPARPATGASLAFVGALVKQVVTQSGSMQVTLDSLTMQNSAYDNAPSTYYLTVSSAVGPTHVVLPVTQHNDVTAFTTSGNIDGGPIDATMAGKFGGSAAYHIAAAYSLTYPGNYYTNTQGRGCINAAFTSPCDYNGARWFDGPSPARNETFPHPTRGNGANGAGASTTNFTNAGHLTGVDTVYEAHAYQTMNNVWRNVEGALGAASTAADYNVYWGTAPGTVDSVIDVTDNVPVPFSADMVHGYTWGFMTQAASNAAGSGDGRPGVLTLDDFGCVEPLKSSAAANGQLGCTTGSFSLVNTAVPGTMAFTTGSAGASATAPVAQNPGFGMYMPGHRFLFEMATAPSKPAVWTLRTYVGGITGGGGAVGSAGNDGSYKFAPQPSPLVAPGTTVAAQYTVTNRVLATTSTGLEAVHTVPDPYYVTNAYEVSPSSKVIKFVNLPTKAIIRIYSTSGVLVRIIEHSSSQFGGEEDWDVRNRNNQVVASGVYFYSVESSSGPRLVKRLTIVNFAQ